jgi:hypothetical protein
MSKYDVIYVRRGVVVRKSNRLESTVESVEKLAIIRELVKKL